MRLHIVLNFIGSVWDAEGRSGRQQPTCSACWCGVVAWLPADTCFVNVWTCVLGSVCSLVDVRMERCAVIFCLE
jgi:hypothetical protein